MKIQTNRKINNQEKNAEVMITVHENGNPISLVAKFLSFYIACILNEKVNSVREGSA